jgi:p-hydroxybenzoate 3-monooxygenase
VRTQVGIVGAGPAGLVLAHLLHLQGIESVVLEARDREYVQQRVRAGVLEQNTVDLLRSAGVADRLDREGIVHHGIELRFDGEGHRIAMSDLTGGRAIWIYGQQEVVKDLIAAREAAGSPPLFEVSDVEVHDVDGDAPFITYTSPEGVQERLDCDVIAGCDGFHGICRPAVGADRLQIAEREYPFGWLGILADVAPSTDELIYAYHDRGFAMHSLRSPTLSRLYLQVDPNDDINNWPDDRIWEELHLRFEAPGWSLTEGPIIEKGITPMRSFVAAPMRRGRLFLAGDAHRPADGGQGPQPRRQRRPRPRRSADGVLRQRLDHRPGRVQRHLPPARLARPGLLHLHDHPPPPPGRRRLRHRPPEVPPPLRHHLRSRRPLPRRELRGPADLIA